MENNSIYSIEDVSTILTGSLPEKLCQYYNDYISVKCADVLNDYIFNKYIVPANLVFQDIRISLQTLISYLLWETLDNENGPMLNEREAMDHFAQKKKNRKKYLHKIVQQEYNNKITPQNPRHMHNGYLSITSPYCTGKLTNEVLSNLTETAFFEQEYKRVESWYKSGEAYVCEYPYFSALSKKKQVEDYLIDLGYFTFSIICNEYFRSRYGIVTRSADISYQAINQHSKDETPAIVNWQDSAISADDLCYEPTKDSILVYELIPSDSGNVRIIVDIIHNVDCSSQSKALEEIDKVKKAYRTGRRISHLDALDHSIITALINNMNFPIATGRENILITFPELAKDVYGSDMTLTLKRSKQLFLRLLKLQKMNISFSERNAEGIPIYGRGIDFFNFEYTVSRNFDSDTTEIIVPSTKDIDISGNAEIANVELLTKDHYNNMLLSITPSEYLRSQWLNGIHTMSTKSYKAIPSQKGKLLYQLLQEERLKIHPANQAKITLMFLKSKIRITTGTETRFKADIAQELSNLVENHILVSGFKTNRTSFDITFLPLDANERILYKLVDTSHS